MGVHVLVLEVPLLLPPHCSHPCHLPSIAVSAALLLRACGFGTSQLFRELGSAAGAVPPDGSGEAGVPGPGLHRRRSRVHLV